jgi:hypothetical protein
VTRFGLIDCCSSAADTLLAAPYCPIMFLFSILSVLPRRMFHAVLGSLRAQPAYISAPLDDLSALSALRTPRSKIYTLAAQTPKLPQNAPTLSRSSSLTNAWLRAVLPVHPTSWLTPCLLPVAANKNRENQHETHVIQCYPRRRDACSHS